MSWPRDLDQLEANLRREVANIDPNMISRALGDIRNRAQLCLDNNALWFKGMGAVALRILDLCLLSPRAKISTFSLVLFASQYSKMNTSFISGTSPSIAYPCH